MTSKIVVNNIESDTGISTITVGSDIQIQGSLVGNINSTGISTVATLNATNANIGSINGGPLAGTRNRIINGDMRISQRGTTFAAITDTTYSLDRYRATFSGVSSVVTISQESDVPTIAGFYNSLRISVTTADTSIGASERCQLAQIVEGYNISDFVGQTFTISFWVRSSKIGVHCLNLANSGDDRSYVAEYNVNVANTWEYKTITVDGGLPSSGTWNFTTGRGLWVMWTLAAGANFYTTPNVWQTSVFRSTANQVNCLDTVGNIFAITGVQLEAGTVATPFERRSFGQELALCQRYFLSATTSATLNNNGTTANISYVGNFPVTMRATPTIAGVTASFTTVNNFTAFANTAGLSWAGNLAFTAAIEL